jgi:hypothetical protein
VLRNFLYFVGELILAALACFALAGAVVLAASFIEGAL